MSGWADLIRRILRWGLSLLFPELGLGRHRLRLPSVIAMLALGIWAMLDVTAAGTALWLLLPNDTGISWSLLLAVYFLALGAVIVSFAPGGLGPFELTLFTLLPSQNPGELMTAIIAFRLVYFAVPALVSAVFLACPRLLKPASACTDVALQFPATALPDTRCKSETGVIRQNGGQLLSCGPE